MVQNEYKKCRDCNKYKTFTEFQADLGRPDGIRSNCRECCNFRKRVTRANRSAFKKCKQCNCNKSIKCFARKKGKNGLDSKCKHCVAQNRLNWKNKNPNYVRPQIYSPKKVYLSTTINAKIWRSKNRDRALESQRQWRTKNKEKANQSRRKWERENPGKRNAQTLLRIARKLQATPKCQPKEKLKEIENIYILAKELQWLSESRLCVDHIIPLRGENVSGLHVSHNLQILPLAMNCSKSNNFDPIEYNKIYLPLLKEAVNE